MATIRQRGCQWQCIVRRKGYPNVTQTFVTKKDAERWARQQEHLIDEGRWIDRSEAERTTLGELLDRYAKEVTPTKRGKDSELLRINAFKRHTLAKYSVAAITPKLIAQWRDERLKEVAGSTVARQLNLLGHVFSVAIREWSFNLHNNPVSMIRKPAGNPPRDRILTDEQRAALVAACGQCRNPWVKPAVIFALETAARRGEILGLAWGDVDLQRAVAKVSGKTGSRKIPLSPACLSMLRALPRSLDGRVFPVTDRALQQAYGHAVGRAGIIDFTFHDLRHDALTRLAKLGLNILELRAISGHTTANMLQRYVSIDAYSLAEKIANSA